MIAEHIAVVVVGRMVEQVVAGLGMVAVLRSEED